MQVFCEDPELYRRTDDAGPEQPIGPELDPGDGRGFPYSELCVLHQHTHTQFSPAKILCHTTTG